MRNRALKSLQIGILLLAGAHLAGLSSSFAQFNYTGKVLDARTGESLPSVSVFVPGTTVGTATDSDGHFTLTVTTQPSSISFSSIGFRTFTLHNLSSTDNPSSQLVIELEPASLDLSPILITAGREMQPRTHVPASISALSISQIDQTKPSLLYEALNQVAGVHVVDLGNEQYKMSIRQPFTNKAYFLFMEDGIPLRPVGIFNPNALIDVNMAGIDRIEVVRGPVSAMYGSNAVAGALNFISRSPATAPSASVSARMDSHGYKRSDFAASVKSNRLGVFVGGYAARQRDAWFEHSDFDKISVTARVDYQFSPSTNLVSALTVSNLDTDTNGALDSLNFFSRNISSLHTFTYRDMGGVRGRSTLTHAWSETARSSVTTYYRNAHIRQLPYYRVRNNRSNPSVAKGEINSDAFWSIGLTGQHEIFFPELKSGLIVGASIDESPATYAAEYIDVERDADGRYVGYVAPDSLLTDYAVRIRNAAAYVRVDVEPVANLRFVSSLRFDHVGYDYNNYLDPTAYSGALDQKSTFDRFSPKVGVTYDLGRGRGLYANYSLGFVPPEVNELFVGVKIPSLKPSSFASYEIGGWAASANGTIFLDLSLYTMDGTNEIIPVILEDDSRENRNAGHTRHRGIEYTLFAQPTDWFSIRHAGTVATHEFISYNENGSDFSGNEMMNAPGWVANSEATFNPPFATSLRFGLEWQRVGSYELDNANTATYEGHDVFHFRTSVTIQSWQIWMNLNNVFDDTYATTAAAYAFGTLYNAGQVRTITLGARYQVF